MASFRHLFCVVISACMVLFTVTLYTTNVYEVMCNFQEIKACVLVRYKNSGR